MKIIVMGASGFLGQSLLEILSKENEVLGTYSNHRRENLHFLDALDKEKVREFLFLHKPEIVIDTVALTSSIQCEKNPGLAKKLNYITARNIAEACREISAYMVFMSSSYLFDGEKGNYNEKDETSPINEYARTKIMAEKDVLKNSKSLILRVDIMYGYNGKKEKNGVFDMILSEKPIQLREPYQIRQPIFVDDISYAILCLISKKQTGIFHLAGPDKIKMIDFLKDLESILRKESLVHIDTKESEGNFPKIPMNSTFNTSKAQEQGVIFTSFLDGLASIKRKLEEN